MPMDEKLHGVAHRVIAFSAAGLLLTASAGFGAVYAWRVGQSHSVTVGCLSVAMALGLELCKPAAVAAAVSAFRTWRLGQGVALAILAATAVAYSLTAELQLMALGRADSVSERAGRSQEARNAADARDHARQQLQQIGAARTGAELAPLIASARLLARDCARIETATQREACLKLPALESEAARASRIAELSAKLEAAEARLAAAGTSRHADPGAAALGHYLAALGVSVRTDRVGDWLVLIAVAAIEIGSALAIVLIGAAPSDRRPRGGLEHGEPVPCLPEDKQDAPSPPAPRHSPALEKLKAIAAGNRVEASQKEIGEALGVPKTTAHRVLRELAASGAVSVSTTNRGTVVEFR